LTLALSLLAEAGIAVGQLLIARKHRSGWLVSLASQPVWFAFAWVTGGWGVAAGAVWFTGVNYIGWRKHA
jgi:hypothetical protein